MTLTLDPKPKKNNFTPTLEPLQINYGILYEIQNVTIFKSHQSKYSGEINGI